MPRTGVSKFWSEILLNRVNCAGICSEFKRCWSIAQPEIPTSPHTITAITTHNHPLTLHIHSLNPIFQTQYLQFLFSNISAQRAWAPEDRRLCTMYLLIPSCFYYKWRVVEETKNKQLLIGRSWSRCLTTSTLLYHSAGAPPLRWIPRTR